MSIQEIEKLREVASLQSKGDSSNIIHHTLFQLSKNYIGPDSNVCDVGCGNGKILKLLRSNYPDLNLNGMDFAEFFNYQESNVHFLQADFNKELPKNYENKFDLVISSEVIEHVENPRHFIRQISNLVSKSGYIILSTPNIESFLSQITFAFKGHHAAFGPTNYPAHITPISSYDLKNMVREIETLQLKSLQYFNNGRIPGTALMWRKIIPFLKGKYFSDNYFVVIQKV